MKVYVDELPDKCEDCVFSETGFVWDSEVRFCKLKPRCMNWIALYDKKRKDCTLCSLAEHDKAKAHQIELLNKRWELLKEYINGFKEYNIEEANMAWILTDKMKELEQEKL